MNEIKQTTCNIWDKSMEGARKRYSTDDKTRLLADIIHRIKGGIHDTCDQCISLSVLCLDFPISDAMPHESKLASDEMIEQLNQMPGYYQQPDSQDDSEQ